MSKYYYEYIRSSEWRNKKKEIFGIKWNSCEKCGSCSNIVIHHWSYASLWFEKINHVFVLCSICHSEFHSIYWIHDILRATKAFILWKEYIQRKKRVRMSKVERRKRRKDREICE